MRDHGKPEGTSANSGKRIQTLPDKRIGSAESDAEIRHQAQKTKTERTQKNLSMTSLVSPRIAAGTQAHTK